MPFSHQNLIRQLEFEGLAKEKAVSMPAIHCGADWNEQAAKASKRLSHYAFFAAIAY